MNIVIYACVDFPEGPATTSRIKMLSKILVESGHNVSLAIFNANAKQPIAANQRTSGIFDSIDFVYLNGKTYRPATFLGALGDTLKGIIKSAQYLNERLKTGRVDAVVFYTPDLPRILPCLLRLKMCRIPMILELCELFSVDRRKGGSKENFKRLIAQISDKVLPAISSGVIVISKCISEHLKLRGIDEAKIYRLPILVDYQRFARNPVTPVGLLSGKRYFLNSGALDEKEGTEFLLEAFVRVSRTHRDIYLVFTGNPSEKRKEYIVEYANKTQIADKLVFTGFLTTEQLSWVYRNAVCLLCCRTNTLFSNFGFPTKLAEYLCSGRPVIVTNVGDYALYLKDKQNAFVAVAESSQSIADSMEAILANPDSATQIGLEGQKVAQKEFDYKNFVQSLDNFVRTAAKCQSHDSIGFQRD